MRHGYDHRAGARRKQRAAHLETRRLARRPARALRRPPARRARWCRQPAGVHAECSRANADRWRRALGAGAGQCRPQPVGLGYSQ
ncbi:hypothetical protein G6F24_018556 [Rhizopus arrhizus]|nr:hypothetical protein G6F24_018556 [Rhizopus arrhizus]